MKREVRPDGTVVLSWPDVSRGFSAELVSDLHAALATGTRFVLRGHFFDVDLSSLGDEASIRRFYLAIEALLVRMAATATSAVIEGEPRGLGAAIAAAAGSTTVETPADAVGLPLSSWTDGLRSGTFRPMFGDGFALELAVMVASCAVAMRTPHVVTGSNVIADMLDLAEVRAHDVVYDLGCGTGEIVIAAARRCRHAVGVDVDAALLARAEAAARIAGVDARFVHADMYTVDITPASVVALYLLPGENLRLRDKLRRELRVGTRIVSNGFDMGDWQPAGTRGNALLWVV